MERLEWELKLPNSKDAVGMPPIPLPHMHDRFSCPGDPRSYLYDLIFVSRDLHM